MTKKLQRMMKDPKPKIRKIKVKKLTKRERLAVRGITLHVGVKKTIDLMTGHIKEQRLAMPVVDLSVDDPTSKFVIQMYLCIGKWDPKHLAMFIEGVTGKIPKYMEPGAMQGTVKAIFHAIFEDSASKEEVRRYDSVWKMWPNVRSKPEKRGRRKEMATNKKKQASKKKVASKKKSRVQKKSAAKKSAATGARVTDDSKVTKTKIKFDPARESFKLDVYNAINGKNNTVAKITKAVGEDRSYVIKELRWLRNRDFVRVTG